LLSAALPIRTGGAMLARYGSYRQEIVMVRLRGLSFRPALRIALSAAVLGLVVSDVAAQPAPCWSLLQSKFGPEIKRSVDEANPCEKMPAGFDHKDHFDVTAFELCTAPNGVLINAQASLACKSGHGILQASVSGKLDASVTVDIGACRITDSHIAISGDVGKYLGEIGQMQDVARAFAQKKMSEICGPAH
jgi:hypothetical protein